jgi:ABC-type transport system involved in cytochrome c biogenesis permease component
VNSLLATLLIGILLLCISGPWAIEAAYASCKADGATTFARKLLLASGILVGTAIYLMVLALFLHRSEAGLSPEQIAQDARERGNILVTSSILWVGFCLSYGLSLMRVFRRFGQTPINE